MSQGQACDHRPREEHVVVVTYHGNYSAFAGYQFTPSDYSAVLCVTCGARWRTNAAWVERCRPATRAERYSAPPPSTASAA